ncbi:MAG: hypothetical protein V3U60_16665 [Gammaproteobacteria bacterium]
MMTEPRSNLAICAGRRRSIFEIIIDGARETTIRAFDLADYPPEQARLIDDIHKQKYGDRGSNG